MMATEVYSQLRSEEIRLLHLNPGEFSDDLTCTLQQVYLPANPVYEALSYTWGLETSPTSLYVNGGSMSITANLESALRHLRHPIDVRVLWVDAICINQADMPERMAQVSQMDVLYSKAEKTVIYLGDLDDESNEALDLMVMFSEDRHLDELAIWTDDSNTHLDLKRLQKVKRLWRYPWWHRVWVIQEVALAREVILVCGTRTLSWDKIILPFTMNIIKHIGECCKAKLTPNDSLEANLIFTMSWHLVQNLHTNRLNIQQSVKPNLLLLLKTYRERDSTDPRDKVYGLLGMASNVAEVGISPDYSITWQEVYKRTAMKIIQTYHDPCVSAHQSLGLSLENEKVGLPSWAPDWSISHMKTPAINQHYWHARTTATYRAGEGIPFLAVRIPDSDLLCLNGIGFDEIAELGDVMTEPEATPATLRIWEERLFDMELGKRAYIGGGTWQEAYWKTVVADLIEMMASELRETGVDKQPGIGIETVAMRFFLMQRHLLEITSRLIWPEPCLANGRTVHPSLDATKRLQHSFTATQNRRFCITKMGYFGTVPDTTDLGDSLHIFCAASTPLVMRKGSVFVHGKEKVGYRIVGDAYIHGIMQGEVTNGKRPLKKYLIY